MTNEFFVTKTIGNKEVRDNLEDWKEAIVAEYEQLVASKGAVKPMSRSDLQALAEKEGKIRCLSLQSCGMWELSIPK